jgi:iron-sulfur cluster repair protein YtfE (RIC family)
MPPSTQDSPALRGLQPFAHGCLCADHDRLGALLQRVRAAASQDDRTEALAVFEHFRDSIESHMRIEEEILFPKICHMEIPAHCELMQSLKDEHAEIRSLSSRLGEAIALGMPDEERLEALESLLSAHEAKEELFLYPMVFRLANPELIAELLCRLPARAHLGQLGGP